MDKELTDNFVELVKSVVLFKREGGEVSGFFPAKIKFTS